MKKIIFVIFLLISMDAFCQNTVWVESTDGTKINYNYNKFVSERLTLIFVHGWCCNQTFWKYQVQHFSDRYNLVTLDISGFGKSESRKNHSYNKWGDDIMAVVNAIKPKEYILIGHSSGGYAVLNAATKADQRLLGLIGIDSYRGKLEKSYTLEFAQKAEAANRLNDTEFRESMKDIDRWFVPQSTKKNIDWIKSEMAECHMESAAQGVREYYLYRNHTAEELKKIKCPVFGINKEQSQFDLDFFRLNQIDFKPYYIKNTGHFVMIDQATIFNEIIEEIATFLL